MDLDKGAIAFSGSAAFIDGKRVEGTTKTGRTRIVSIDPGTVRVLQEHRKRQAADQLRAGAEWRGEDDYVFTTGWGDPFTRIPSPRSWRR